MTHTTPPISPDDARFLRRTLALARRGHGRTSPNPMVGAVVVHDGVVVGEGFHPKAGEPHAEVFALRAAGAAAQGATLYVSLEPCSHFGRTPPCADAVIAAGITRVVFASLDPNPLVAGRGVERLRAAGVAVAHGALAADEARLNEAYRHWIVTRLPFTTLKLAASLDGKVATRTGASQWITGPDARRDVHRLRSQSDAILTTAATVLADDPALTARLPGGRDPQRIVVDARLRTLPSARVYAPASRPPVLATLVTDDARLAPFRAQGVDILTLSPLAEGYPDLAALWRTLGARSIQTLMVECGGTFAAAVIAARLVHKLRLYYGPLLIGGREAYPLLGGTGVANLDEAWRLHGLHCKRLGDDLRIDGYIENATPT